MNLSDQNTKTDVIPQDLEIRSLKENGLFSEEIINALYRVGINTVAELIEKTSNEVSCIRGVGERSLNHIRFVLYTEFNLFLKDETYDIIAYDVTKYLDVVEAENRSKELEITIALETDSVIENLPKITNYRKSFTALRNVGVVKVEDLSNITRSTLENLVHAKVLASLLIAMRILDIQFRSVGIEG